MKFIARLWPLSHSHCLTARQVACPTVTSSAASAPRVLLPQRGQHIPHGRHSVSSPHYSGVPGSVGAQVLLGDCQDLAHQKDRNYVDRILLQVKAGAGGAGCGSFFKAKGRQQTPDGGDGGNGGSVYLRASNAVKSLAGLKQQIRGPAGAPGARQGRHGAHGADVVVDVPLGTVVYMMPQDRRSAPTLEDMRVGGMATRADPSMTPVVGEDSSQALLQELEQVDINEVERIRLLREREYYIKLWSQGWDTDDGDRSTAEQRTCQKLDIWKQRKQDGSFLADLVQQGQQCLVAKGGRGGQGNAKANLHRGRNPASWLHQAHSRASLGTAGEHVKLLLEMKSLADVGLIGFPNVGKSTLLRALSSAHPAVAPYAFTTLRPQLGVLHCEDGARITVADTPGLIQGAHANRGLGHSFLRHIERCSCLVFVVDATGGLGSDTRPVAEEQLHMLREELRLYEERLLRRPWLVVVNKVDMVQAADKLDILQRINQAAMRLFPVSMQDVLSHHEGNGLVHEGAAHSKDLLGDPKLQLPHTVAHNTLQNTSLQANNASDGNGGIGNVPILCTSGKHELGIDALKVALAKLVPEDIMQNT